MNWILANTLFALGLALLVGAACRLLRPRPALAHGLWALVLLRLCWPPCLGLEVEVAFGAAPSAVSPAGQGEREATPPAVSASPVPLAVSVPTALARSELPVSTPPGPLAPSRASATALLPIAWAIGSSLCGLWLLLGLWRGTRRYRRARPVPAWLGAEVGTLAVRMGIRPPRVVDDRAATTPCVWAFGRPRLVTSSAALRAIPPVARAAMLAHELAHLRRRDHWFLHGELLLAVVFFWHPLFWLLRARMREQAELACDAWALWAAPGSRRDYAGALIAALERTHPAPALPVLAARPGARRLFERRLSMILHESVPCRLSRAALAGFAVLALGVVIAPVRAQERAAKPEAKAPKVEITVDGVSLDAMSTRQQQRVLRELGLTGEALQLVLRARSLDAGVAPAAPPAKADDPQAKKPRVDKSGFRVEAEVEDHRNELEVLEKLKGLDKLKGLEKLKGLDKLKGLEKLKGLDKLKGLEKLEILDELKGLEKLKGLDELKGLEQLEKVDLNGLMNAPKKGDLNGLLNELKRAKGRNELEERNDPQEPKAKAPKEKARQRRAPQPAGPGTEPQEPEPGLGGEIRAALQQALGEAKQELQADPDLRELSITEDVLGLVAALGGKGDFASSLQQLIGKAVRGATRRAQQEVAADPELQRLGIADDLGKLLADAAQNQDLRQGLSELIGKAMRGALAEASSEVAADADLRQLGIADDVAALIDDLGAGRFDLQKSLRPLIEKAVRSGLEQAKTSLREKTPEPAATPRPRRSPK